MPTPEIGFVRSAIEEEEEEGRADGGAKGGDEGALEDASEEDGREGGEDHPDWQDLADQRHLFCANYEEEEAELRREPAEGVAEYPMRGSPRHQRTAIVINSCDSRSWNGLEGGGKDKSTRGRLPSEPT